MASKTTSRLVLVALVLGLLPFGAASAQAADLGVVSIDCDAADIAGATIVATGGVGDTFVIDNTGTTDNCVITATALLTGEEADHDSAGAGVVTPGGGNSGSITVVASGTFTISSSGTGTPARSFVIDACSLEGSGVAANPWRVGTQADFQKIGNTTSPESCTLSGHYLQTGNLTLNDWSNDRVVGDFSGVYDGDHYSIMLGASNGSSDWDYETRSSGGPTGLFEHLEGGTIKKVSLSGTIVTVSSEPVGALAKAASLGAVISEVSSGVTIVSKDPDPVVGGIVGEFILGNVRIQYSRSNATIQWGPIDPAASTYLGGLVGYANPQSSAHFFEIRDSYSRAEFSLDTTLADQRVGVGGLVGGINDQQGSPTPLVPFYFVRNYSVATIDDSCTIGGGVLCDRVEAGALVETYRSATVYVSNFFRVGGGFTTAVDGGTQPAAYDGSGNPVAAPLSVALLKSISTYQSAEDGSSEVPDGASGLAADSDFRWAIEPINVQTFVPSSYAASPAVGSLGTASEQSDYTNRGRYPDADPMATASYLRERLAGTTDLTDVTLSRGSDAATTDNYPRLGRVWDICDDYPTLVWEEQTSCTGSGGGSSGSSSSSASTNPGGLSDAEYAEYLASGLTLEQFLAARLAATGVPSSALSLGFGAMLALLGLGVALVWVTRRERVSGRL